MRLAIVSHKTCWPSAELAAKYVTDGGFPVQIGAISELFDRTALVVPCYGKSTSEGTTEIIGRNIDVAPLSIPAGKGFVRKLLFPLWLIGNAAENLQRNMARRRGARSNSRRCRNNRNGYRFNNEKTIVRSTLRKLVSADNHF